MGRHESGSQRGSRRAVEVVGRGLLAAGTGSRAAILVEGPSDRCAFEALARRRGRDLRAEGVAVVPMGGATNIRHFLEHLGPRGLGLELAGVCDAAEQRCFRRALESAGLGDGLTSTGMEALGFYACVEDLEDELIRALGVTRVVQVIADEGELTSFRTLQSQPAQRERPVEQQLRRFLGSGSGRKTRYATLLVEALDLDRAPRALDLALARV